MLPLHPAPARTLWRFLVLLFVLTVAAAGLDARELAYMTPVTPAVKKAEPKKTVLKQDRAPSSASSSQPQGRKKKTVLDEVAGYRRVLWVTRWDFESADDIKRICYNAASARFTDVLFQVRGEGTVYYKSDVEPWAWELTGGGPDNVGRDPGWDPLAVAVREGHKQGLRVHAYLNVLPGWGKPQAPSRSSGQLWATHRDWFMVDADGDRMSPARWYAFLDPGLPEVRQHLARLFGEVAANYAIDGVHLDYIRYPEEQGDYGYHPRVVAQFRQKYGASPQRMPKEWARYRSEQVTAVVAAIHDAVKEARPQAEVTAAVIASDSRRENECHQPALEWLRKDIVDAVAPMNYTDDMDRFDTSCRSFAPYKDRVWMGVWAQPDRNSELVPQVRRAATRGFGGVAVFAYGDLFSQHRSTRRARGVYETFVSQN